MRIHEDLHVDRCHATRSHRPSVKKSQIYLLYANKRNTSDFVNNKSFLKTLTFKEIFFLKLNILNFDFLDCFFGIKTYRFAFFYIIIQTETRISLDRVLH